jgi:hypothetical protein
MSIIITGSRVEFNTSMWLIFGTNQELEEWTMKMTIRTLKSSINVCCS